jgi:hypothetical protein
MNDKHEFNPNHISDAFVEAVLWHQDRHGNDVPTLPNLTLYSEGKLSDQDFERLMQFFDREPAMADRIIESIEAGKIWVPEVKEIDTIRPPDFLAQYFASMEVKRGELAARAVGVPANLSFTINPALAIARLGTTEKGSFIDACQDLQAALQRFTVAFDLPEDGKVGLQQVAGLLPYWQQALEEAAQKGIEQIELDLGGSADSLRGVMRAAINKVTSEYQWPDSVTEAEIEELTDNLKLAWVLAQERALAAFREAER